MPLLQSKLSLIKASLGDFILFVFRSDFQCGPAGPLR